MAFAVATTLVMVGKTAMGLDNAYQTTKISIDKLLGFFQDTSKPEEKCKDVQDHIERSLLKTDLEMAQAILKDYEGKQSEILKVFLSSLEICLSDLIRAEQTKQEMLHTIAKQPEWKLLKPWTWYSPFSHEIIDVTSQNQCIVLNQKRLRTLMERYAGLLSTHPLSSSPSTLSTA